MDLATLKFKVETDEVEAAVKSVDRLVDAVEKLEKPIGQMVTSAKKVADAAGDLAEGMGKAATAAKPLAQNTEAAGDSLSKVERMIEKAGLSLAVLRNQTIGTSDGTIKLEQSFTKMQAGMLANAKMAGATTDQMKMLAAIIEETNQRMGQNPFDKSASSLARLKKEVEEMTEITALQAQGLALTGEELRGYARDISSVNAAMKAEGASIEQVNAALERLRKETLEASQAKAVFTRQAKEAEEQIKREAQAKLAAERAAMSMNNEAVALFMENEKKKQKAVAETEKLIRDQASAQQRQQLQSQYVGQGYSTSASGRAATMQMKGVPQDVINSFLLQAKAMEESNRAARQTANALRYLDDTEARLNEQLKEGVDMHHRFTDQLVRVRTELAKTGLSTAAATKRYEELEKKINAVAAKDKQRELANLSRAISVQMGDVGISLASGMNPLLVMIQQGDQIRGAIQQVGVKGKQLQGAMSTAAKQIAESFVLTGKALGGFLVGAINSAGVAVGNMTKQLPGIKEMSEAYATLATNAAAVGDNKMASFIRGLGAAFTFTTGAATVFAGAMLLAVPVALIQSIRQNEELVRALTLSGGALNLSTERAYLYASSMKEAGVSTATAMKVIAEMGKTGELGSSAIRMVTIAANDLKVYGGVAIEDTVKKFASLAKDPVDALFKIAKETGMVSEESLRLVESLRLQGREVEAQAAAMQAYADLTSQQIARLKEDYTDLGLFMIELGKSIKSLYTDMKDGLNSLFFNTARIVEVRKQLKAVEDEIDNGGSLAAKLGLFNDALIQRRENLRAELRLLSIAEEKEKARTAQLADQRKLQEEAAKLREKGLTREQAFQNEIAEIRGKISRAAPADKEAFNADLLKAAKEYASYLNEQANRTRQLTDAQREANKLKNDEEALIKRIREQMNGSVAQQLQLSAAEKMRLDILGDERFKSQPETVRKAIEALLQQAIATERVADAEAARLKAHDDVNAALRRGNAVLGKATDLGSDYYNVQDMMFKLLESGAKVGLDYSDYVLRVLAALEATTPAARATADANKSLAEMTRELSLETYNVGLALEDERNELILGSAENKRRIQLRKIDLDYIKDITEALKAKAAAEAKGGDVDPAQFQAAINAAGAKRDAMIESLGNFETDFYNSLRKTLPDVIYDALTGKGKNAAKTLRDFLEQELVKKPFTVFVNAITDVVMNSIGGFTNGVAQGATSAGGGMLNSIFGSTLSTAAMSTYGTAFGKAMLSSMSTGGSFAGGTWAGMGSVAGAIGKGTVSTTGASGASMAGSAAGIGAGIAGGFYGGRMISGGYSTGGSGNRNVNSGVAIGAIVGSIVPVIGTAIGALVGGLIGGGVNRLFGRKLQDEGIRGQFGPNGFTGENFRFEKGGLFKSDRTTTSALDPVLAGELGYSFKTLKDSVSDLAKGIGVSESVISGFTKSLNISMKGVSQEDLAKKLTEFFTELTEEMADLVLGDEGKKYAKEGETSIQTLTRLKEALEVVNQGFSSLGVTLKDVSLVGANSANRFIELFGGVQQMTSAIDKYYQAFYTEQERTAKAAENLQKAFTELNLGLVPTGRTVQEARDNFRKLVTDALNSGNEELAVSLINLAGAFDELNPKVDSLAGKFGTLIGNLFNEAIANIDKQIAASQKAATEARRVASEYFSVASSLREFAKSLRGEESGANYRMTLTAAQGGDIDAMQKLQGVASSFIESARQNSTSTEEYNHQVAQVQQEILQVAALANVQGTGANYQAQLLDINTAVLEEIKASIETQNVTADLLREQLDALATVGELITASANLTVAQSITNTGELKTGLVDNAGNVIAGIDNTTAQQLAAIAAQTNAVNNTATSSASTIVGQLANDTGVISTGLVNNSTVVSGAVTTSTNGQTVSLNNLIGGNIATQTAQLTGLSADQLAALSDVESAGVEQVDIAEIVARASTESSALLRSVVSRLDSDNSSFASLIATVGTGNEAIRNTLNNILTQLQVNGNVPGVDQGFVGPIATQQQLALAAAQTLLVQIRDTQTPGIVNAESLYNDYIGSSQYEANEAEYALTGDYRVVQDQRAQAEILNQQLADLIARLQRDLDAQRQIIISLGGVPAFAEGGMHSGGLRLVGENGPELEVTGPSRIFNASQTASMLSGNGNSELLEVLIEKVSMLEAAARSTAVSNSKMAKILDRVSPDGNSLQVSPAV